MENLLEENKGEQMIYNIVGLVGRGMSGFFKSSLFLDYIFQIQAK